MFTKRILLTALVALSFLATGASVMAQQGEMLREEFHQTYPLAADGRVSLGNINGSVRVTAWDRNEVKVDAVKMAYRRDRLDEAKIVVRSDTSGFHVETQYPYRSQTFTDGEGRYNNPAIVEYTLMVPHNARIDSIELINGNLDIDGITGDVKASSINGRVSAHELMGEVKLSTINGKLDAMFGHLNESSAISLGSVNGPVLLTIPSDSNAELKAGTVHGGIANDFGLPVRRGDYVGRDLAGQLGQGGARIKLGNVNGSITIKHAPDGRPLSRVTSLLAEKIKDKDKDDDDDDYDVDDARSESQRAARESAREAQRAQIEARRAQVEAQRTQIEAQRAQRQAQAEAQRAQVEAQRAQIEAQRAAQQEGQRAQIEAQRAQREAQIEAQRAQMEAGRAQLEGQRAALEGQREAQRAQLEAQRAAQQAQRDAMIEAQRAQAEGARATQEAQRAARVEAARVRAQVQRVVREAARIGTVNVESSNTLRLVERETKSFTVSGTPHVNLQTFDGSITVRGWDKQEVQLIVSKRAASEQQMRGIQLNMEQHSSDIVIVASFDKNFASRVPGISYTNALVNLDVYVPRSSMMRLASGDGHLELEGVNGNLDLNTGDGRIEVRDARGSLAAKTGGGRIDVENFNGSVEARTGDGRIILDGRFAQLAARTGGGTIMLTVPADFNATIETDAESVQNESGLTLTEESSSARRLKRWKIGRGGNVLTLRTGDGRIILRSAGQ
ncbi:MAG TPA: hypothetical protein VGN95_08485 [Pyrinomonadaceae bacterium]|nr:hypothetical protein [Pyrinomonadaceae bacterium]